MTVTEPDVVPAVEEPPITEPGVYDMTAERYHADPVTGGSLSQSGAKLLLDPFCPALFDYWRTHPEPPKKAYDFGHAAHRAVLGIGVEIEIFPKHDARTKEGKVIRAAWDAARAAGRTPITADDAQVVQEMATALRAHELGGKPLGDLLLNPEWGKPEQALFWRDTRFGVWRRALLDWLPTRPTKTGRLILADYKTSASAAAEDFRKAIANYGYDMQAAWYSAAVEGAGLADDIAFVFVVQEKTPPYLVNVIQIDGVWMKAGRKRNDKALAVYAECTKTGRWPGYSEHVEVVSPPGWLENRYLEEGVIG